MSVQLGQLSYLYQQQQQQQIAKQMEKYQNGIAEYNMNKVIRFYTQAINSAETAGEAKYLAESLDSLLSNYGKSSADVDGINNPLLTDPTATAGKAHGAKKRGNAQDKEVIKDLSEEFGIDVKKRGTTKDWLQKAKNDENVRILDKNGKDITAEREGRIKKGDILEVNSKKHGKVKISVGGDGEINGGDDRVIEMGGKAAANGIFHGLNELNKVPAETQQAAGALTGAGQGNPLLAGLDDPALNNLDLNGKLFSQEEINNLLAAILNNALQSIEQKEDAKKYGIAV